MKTRRLILDERRGFCHDCHNRARIEVTFAHRTEIRLCDRCGRFLVENVAAVISPPRNGKNDNGKNGKSKARAGRSSSQSDIPTRRE
jgi:hypothetical protein